MNKIFSFPFFFIIFRETFEAGLIVTVLLSLIDRIFVSDDPDDEISKRLRKMLKTHVYLGASSAIFLCLFANISMFLVFYFLKKDFWSNIEDLWEGIFSLFISILVTLVGFSLLRISKLKQKWSMRLEKIFNNPDEGIFKRYSRKYIMFLLPFFSIIREGLEVLIFVTGIGVTELISSMPLAGVMGLLSGIILNIILYKGSSIINIRYFFTCIICVFYFMAAIMFSKAFLSFDDYAWTRLVGGDAAESGSGPGSYDVRTVVWHVNCCNPKIASAGGWQFLNSVFGWSNTATINSVTSYCLYWPIVSAIILYMYYRDTRKNHKFKYTKMTEAKTENNILQISLENDTNVKEKYNV